MASAKKIVNGIEFDADTPDRVVDIILRYMGNYNQRIRVFYGDPKTGRDYGEEYNIMGYVGRSGGTVKIPLLINNTRSFGGPGLLDGIIVRITVDKRNVYVHPKYKCDVVVKGNEVYLNGKLHARCKTHEKAEKLAAFYRGDSNVKG